MKKIYILLTCLFLSQSCNVLDQASPNDVDDLLVFNSEDGANAALIGLYNSLQARDYYGGYYPLIADLYSDVGTAGGFDNVALDEISVLEVTTSNIIVENTWLAIYYTIATANAIITRVDGVQDPTFTQEEKNHIKGQALVIRALAHFDALRMFGEHWNPVSDFGIPVVTTIQKANDVQPRSNVQASYTAIVKDLNDAGTLILADDRSRTFVNRMTAKALLARVYLHQGNRQAAYSAATTVINDGAYSLVDADNLSALYTSPYLSSESIFELTFNVQNRSAFNATTFSRPEALRTEVLFLAESGLSGFFEDRTGDVRADLIDFTNNDESIIPDGRTQKYRGEETRDNPAYIIRLADVYLIRAEAAGLGFGGLADLNAVRTHRGLSALTSGNFSGEAEFELAILDERKAELNFEGTRMFDLARTGLTAEVLGIDAFRSIFPIPYREIIATKGQIKQNPGYED